MEELGKIVGISLCASVGSLLLRRQQPEFAFLLALATVLLLLGSLGTLVRQLLREGEGLLQSLPLQEELLAPVLRTLGVAVTARIGSSLCQDAGQNAMAAVIEMGGGVCAVLTALPLVQGVMRLLLGWL